MQNVTYDKDQAMFIFQVRPDIKTKQLITINKNTHDSTEFMVTGMKRTMHIANKTKHTKQTNKKHENQRAQGLLK